LGSTGQQPSFSPDGRWIVFTQGDYVKEIRPSGQGIRHILYVRRELRAELVGRRRGVPLSRRV